MFRLRAPRLTSSDGPAQRHHYMRPPCRPQTLEVLGFDRETGQG
jgi:hypothetical protein